MTEDDARGWIAQRWGDAAVDRLSVLRELVVDETKRQSLISSSTIATIWFRHLVDSAQLVVFADGSSQSWLDIGSGAGFPGLVVAILRPDMAVTLCEPRRRRMEFLAEVVEHLKLRNVALEHRKCQDIPPRSYDIISARAVASLPVLLNITPRLRSPKTQLILPKGRSGKAELESLPARWQRLFHVEQSITDPEAVILIGEGVV